MKKIFIGLLLLILTACSPKTEEDLYIEQCRKVYFCNQWLEENSDVDFQAGELLTEVKAQLTFFGDDIEAVTNSITAREEVLEDIKDMDETTIFEYLVYEILPLDKESYSINLIEKPELYNSVSVVELEPINKLDITSQNEATLYIKNMIDLLYNELNVYYQAKIKVSYKATIVEDYLDGEIAYQVSSSTNDSGDFEFVSNIDLMKWEYIRSGLFDELRYNTFIQLEPYNMITTSNKELYLNGFTIDEIFLAVGEESYIDKAYEVYDEIINYLNSTGYPYDGFEFKVTVQKEYLVLDVTIQDDHEVGDIFVPLNQYFNRKFLQLIEENHVENTSNQSKELKIEFTDNDTLIVKLYVIDKTEGYISMNDLDIKVNQMVEDLIDEFGVHGYTVETVIYTFDVNVEIEGYIENIKGKHIDSINENESIDWYDVYFEQNE